MASGEPRPTLPAGSLKARLVGHFLLLSLLIVALASYLGFIGARRALEQSVIDRLTVVATRAENQLRHWVDRQRRETVFLASLPEVRTLSRSLLAAEQAEALPPPEAAREELRRFLEQTIAIQTDLEEILVLADAGGEIALSTDRRREGEYRVRDSFFQEGRRGTYVQNVYPSPMGFEPTLTISTPLIAPEGERLGVLAVHLDLEEIDRVIQGHGGLGRSGEIYVIDKYNSFVSGSRFGRDRFLRGVHTAGIDAAVEGADGSGLYPNYDGIDVIGAYRWVDDLDLALVVEIAQREAFAPARRLARRILGVGLLLALVLTASTIVLAHRIARPVVRMTEAARRVAGGDLTASAPVMTRDEIGELARAFNEMTARLRSVLDELRQEIAERRQTQRELETKNAQLERFTYTVSHDLKSPLVTIKGFLGMLQRDAAAGDAERMRSDIERIRRAADTMGRLLHDLLELSRIGRQINRREPVDLGELVREVCELLAGAIRELGIEIDVAPDLPTVSGDRLRLLEVYQNLIGNAVKFMGGQPSPKIEVGTRRDGDERILFVSDNGVGIHPEYHETIFGLFERLDAQVDGTGVGLTLAKRIVEVHGGRIWVESAGEGKGSVFCFTLPDAGTDPAIDVGANHGRTTQNH